jgi:hypothetical protein
MRAKSDTGRVFLIALVAVALAFGLYYALRPPPRPAPPGPPRQLPTVVDSTIYTTGMFDGCPPEGDGGDRDLNRLKNRDMPPPSYETMSVSQMLTDRPERALEEGRKPRRLWSEAARTEVSEWERKGVSVEGHLLRVKQEGPESCNCHAEDHRDFHLWLGADPDDDRGRSVVVEISPRFLPDHPNWRLRILRRLVEDGARVRISGWLMWDQEHPEQIGQTRGTLWEIHPIHKIEVSSGGVWREL